MKKEYQKPQVTDLAQAKDVIDFLWQRNLELEDKLNQNSNNSSKLSLKNKPLHKHQNKRKKSNKPVGAQLKHKGFRRMPHLHDEHMTVDVYKPALECNCAGTMICHSKPSQGFQIFDLPELNYTVTEHQAYKGTCCRCGEKHATELPATISQSQMGCNLLSFIAIQNSVYHQSVAKVQSMPTIYLVCIFLLTLFQKLKALSVVC